MKTTVALIIALLTIPQGGWAAVVSGQVWQKEISSGTTTATNARAFAESGVVPEVTFTSATIPFFNLVAVSTKVIDGILTPAGATATGNAGTVLGASIWRMRGFITIGAGNHTISAKHNDSLSVIIGGQTVYQEGILNNLTKSFTMATGGTKTFDLVYSNNNANGELSKLLINGSAVTFVDDPNVTVGPIPLPASGMLLLSVAGAFGLLRTRRRNA